MLGPPDADGADSYVLGEINVSSVFPIPDEASAAIARRVASRPGRALKEYSMAFSKPSLGMSIFSMMRVMRKAATRMCLAKSM
jgi:hypothetical protein